MLKRWKCAFTVTFPPLHLCRLSLLFFHVGFFKAKSLLAVNDLQHKPKHKGCHAKAGKHHKRGGVVV